MSEQGEAQRDGSRLQPNSGRGKYAKGDARRKFFLVDYKEANRSFTLNKAVWAKVATDALRVNSDLLPVLKVILGEEAPKKRLAIVDWAVIEEYEEMRERLEEIDND